MAARWDSKLYNKLLNVYEKIADEHTIKGEYPDLWYEPNPRYNPDVAKHLREALVLLENTPEFADDPYHVPTAKRVYLATEHTLPVEPER